MAGCMLDDVPLPILHPESALMLPSRAVLRE